MGLPQKQPCKPQSDAPQRASISKLTPPAWSCFGYPAWSRSPRTCSGRAEHVLGNPEQGTQNRGGKNLFWNSPEHVLGDRNTDPVLTYNSPPAWSCLIPSAWSCLELLSVEQVGAGRLNMFRPTRTCSGRPARAKLFYHIIQ